MMQSPADTIERAAPADFNDLLDMLNEVFGEHGPHDFLRKIPSIYRPTAEHTQCNLMIRRDGRIAAVVGVFPIDLRVGDETLRIAGIGGVSTRNAYRGQGLMQQLMTSAIESIHEGNYDLSYLGGQRQRYRYYGYERAGTTYRMRVTTSNLRHEYPNTSTPLLTLKEMGDNLDLIEQARALHTAQPMYCLRERAPFADYLHQWKRIPWAACDAQGNLAGYVVASLDPAKKDVPELVAKDPAAAMAIARLWVEKAGSADFIIPALPTPFAMELSRICEYISLETTGNWRIFNWPAVLTALLKLRHRIAPLPLGEVVVQITESHSPRLAGGNCENGETLASATAGQPAQTTTLRLYVTDADAGCRLTTAAPDLQLTTCDAVRLLFGPTPPNLVTGLPPRARLLQAWCPLPLEITHTDHV